MIMENEIINIMNKFTKEGLFNAKVKYLLDLYKVSAPLKRYFIWQKLKEMGVSMEACQMRVY